MLVWPPAHFWPLRRWSPPPPGVEPWSLGTHPRARLPRLSSMGDLADPHRRLDCRGEVPFCPAVPSPPPPSPSAGGVVQAAQVQGHRVCAVGGAVLCAGPEHVPAARPQVATPAPGAPPPLPTSRLPCPLQELFNALSFSTLNLEL